MPEELNLNLLRSYADGELPEVEASRVEAQLAADLKWREVLENEQQLRGRIESIMRQGGDCPAGLRERIVTELQSASEIEPVAAGRRGQGAVSGEHTGVFAAIRSLFEGPRRVSVAAVAAVMILVAAAVLVGIFGPQVDRGGAQPHMPPSALLAAVAQHVSQEHDRCAGSHDALMSKLIAMTEADAAIRLQSHLGVEPVTIFDLSDLGYRFVGVGPCAMPGVERSAHLIYRREVPGEPQSMMSIFVTPNRGQFPEKCADSARSEGRWSGVCGGKKCSKTILHGTDEQLVYFLACGYPEQVQQVSRSICKALSRRGR